MLSATHGRYVKGVALIYRCTDNNQYGIWRLASQKQQIGVKRGALLDISQQLIRISPNKSKSHTERLQRGASNDRRRLPICETDKVRWMS